mgnify:CR=1 FL=1
MEKRSYLDECLRSRRSVRKFTDTPVSREEIRNLLEMAILAPSASNLQPWRFVVVDEPRWFRKSAHFLRGLEEGLLA